MQQVVKNSKEKYTFFFNIRKRGLWQMYTLCLLYDIFNMKNLRELGMTILPSLTSYAVLHRSYPSLFQITCNFTFIHTK